MRFDIHDVGDYTEKLADGGTLHVSPGNWTLTYYIPGPDLRYHGHVVSLNIAKAPDLISALRLHWEQLQRLRQSMPADSRFTIGGSCGISIHVGGAEEGLSLSGGRTRLRSLQELVDYIRLLDYALQRAIEVSCAMRGIAAPSQRSKCRDAEADTNDLAPGRIMNHAEFGQGMILDMEYVGKDIRLVVQFQDRKAQLSAELCGLIPSKYPHEG